jgi:hypothetical protein
MSSKIEILRRALRHLLAQHQADGTLPTSARFIFYELVAAGVIPKHATGARRADQDMVAALKDLRDAREIPWEWVVDETRALEDATGYASIAEGVGAYMNAIRLDPWDGAAPLILTESRSLAGVLRSLVREYAAKVGPTNGQCGGFLHTDVVPHLRDGARVLYLGDYDLSGNQIEANTRRVLERYHSLSWERLALTRDQVDRYSLPIITKRDKRFKNGGAHEAVETEALSQRLIVEIVLDRLDELLPAPLEGFLAREEIERERLQVLLGRA